MRSSNRRSTSSEASPSSALLPLFVIFLGIDDGMKVGLIMISMIPYIALNTIEGVRSGSPVELENCQVYGIPRYAQVFRIVLPSAAPMIFAALRFGLSVALAVMVVSEMYVANSGIGYFTILSQRSSASSTCGPACWRWACWGICSAWHLAYSSRGFCGGTAACRVPRTSSRPRRPDN